MRQGTAWLDISARGRLRATGEDRVRLLHAIASNDVENLDPGQGTYTFFLDAHGRIQADSHIFVAPDHVMVDCEPAAAERLRQHIENYIIMDDVALEDVRLATALLALAGPEAASVASALVPQLPARNLAFSANSGVRAYRMPVGDAPGFWLLAPAQTKQSLVERLLALGAVAASERAWEAHRVRNGVPRFGVDFGPRNIPQETQQLRAVSFSKGCYTGQEIVERVRSRGQVRRLLVGIELDTAEVPADSAVMHKGRVVGELTSPTPGAPPNGKALGFAIVRSPAAAPGTPVDVGGARGRTLNVARR